MLDAAVRNIEIVGAGNQLDLGQVIGFELCSKCAAKYCQTTLQAFAVLGDLHRNRHAFTIDMVIILVDSGLQAGCQLCSIGGVVEFLVSLGIGCLGFLKILHTVGSRIVACHLEHQVTKSVGIALAGIGGDPQCGDIFCRGIQIKATTVEVEHIRVGHTLNSANITLGKTGKLIAACQQRFLDGGAALIIHKARLNQIAGFIHRYQCEATGLFQLQGALIAHFVGICVRMLAGALGVTLDRIRSRLAVGIFYCDTQCAGNTATIGAGIAVAVFRSDAQLIGGDRTLSTQSILTDHNIVCNAFLAMANYDHIVDACGNTIAQHKHTGIVFHNSQLAAVGLGQLSVAGSYIQHVDTSFRHIHRNLGAVDSCNGAGNGAVIIVATKLETGCLLDLGCVGQGTDWLLCVGEPTGNINDRGLIGFYLVPGRCSGNHGRRSIVAFCGNGAGHLHIADGSGDDRSAFTHSGDLTVLIHGSCRFVGGSPQNRPIGGLCRKHGRRQGHAVTDPQMLCIAVQKNTGNCSAGRYLGDVADDKVEAVQPAIVVILQDHTVTGFQVIRHGNLDSNRAITVVSNVQLCHVHIVIRSATGHIIDSDIGNKRLAVFKGHINCLGAFFHNDLMGRNRSTPTLSLTGGNIHQVTILIVLNVDKFVISVVRGNIAAGALVANHDSSNSRGDLCRLGIHCVGILRHHIVNAVFGGDIYGDGVGICTVIRQGGNFFPITVIQRHLQTLAAGDRHEVFCSCASAPLLGLDSQSAATFSYFVDILIEGSEVALVIEAPVGEHGQVNGITVGQQDIVGGRTPAGAHIGVAVIAVIHQVAIMTPELVHKDTGSCTGIHQRLVIAAVIGKLTAHIENIVLLGILQHTGGAVTALLFRQTHIVALQQVDIQVQAGGTTHYIFINVRTFAAVGLITVVLLQTV